MVKHTQTNRRLLPTNCLSVFNYFVGLALKGLNSLQTLREEIECKRKEMQTKPTLNV